MIRLLLIVLAIVILLAVAKISFTKGYELFRGSGETAQEAAAPPQGGTDADAG